MADDQPIQVVVPADMIVDLERLRELARARVVRLGTEDEFATLYPECERGAMPPFGPLCGQRVYVDTSLVDEPENRVQRWHPRRRHSYGLQRFCGNR